MGSTKVDDPSCNLATAKSAKKPADRTMPPKAISSTCAAATSGNDQQHSSSPSRPKQMKNNAKTSTDKDQAASKNPSNQDTTMGAKRELSARRLGTTKSALSSGRPSLMDCNSNSKRRSLSSKKLSSCRSLKLDPRNDKSGRRAMLAKTHSTSALTIASASTSTSSSTSFLQWSQRKLLDLTDDFLDIVLDDDTGKINKKRRKQAEQKELSKACNHNNGNTNKNPPKQIQTKSKNPTRKDSKSPTRKNSRIPLRQEAKSPTRKDSKSPTRTNIVKSPRRSSIDKSPSRNNGKGNDSTSFGASSRAISTTNGTASRGRDKVPSQTSASVAKSAGAVVVETGVQTKTVP